MKKTMTGKQLQRLIDKRGLSQCAAARTIGIGDRQMRRYIRGEVAIPRPVEIALRVVCGDWGPEDDQACLEAARPGP